ncbi:MAG: lysophospholipid acyltransferase family protein [Acidimicrobiales bacterium]
MAHGGIRRTVTVSVLVLIVVLLTCLVPLWVPLTAAYDLARGKRRLPTMRLLAFGLLWAWNELAGVTALFGIWLVGRGRNRAAHYAVQAWWCRNIIVALRITVGLRVEVIGAERAARGPYVVLARHASLADSIISCFVVNNTMGLNPRYVLKSDLQNVPCLDILGHRTPNCFVHRGTGNVQAELEALSSMMEGLTEGDAAVIFPEGSRANPAKQERELGRLAERHPERHSRLSGLRRLLPPKPAGAGALLAAAPHADVVTVWHEGLDGLDTFPGMLEALSERSVRAHVVVTFHPRSEVPSGPAFEEWIDRRWVEMDDAVAMFAQAPGV